MKDAPDKERIENFREEIYEKQVIHNGEACWIKDQHQPHPNMEWKQVSEQDVADALRTTLNWKDPEKTKCQIFGLNNLQQRINIWR